MFNEANYNQRSFLVLLPEGVVQCWGSNSDSYSWLYFPGIYRIDLAQKTKIAGIDGDIFVRTDYWLDIYSQDGSYDTWQVSDCFGDTLHLYKTVIAAYNHYWRYN
jgi:hypothetical protein